MKLTKEARTALRIVLGHAEAAQTYLSNERTAVCVRRDMATTTLDYVRPSDGAVLYEVKKAYGSDLCQLQTAIDRLGAFLATH